MLDPYWRNISGRQSFAFAAVQLIAREKIDKSATLPSWGAAVLHPYGRKRSRLNDTTDKQ
jgi:hypothetical protein